MFPTNYLSDQKIVAYIQKAIIDGTIGGTLSAEDVAKFVQLIPKMVPMLSEFRIERDIRTSRNVHSLKMGENVMVSDDTVGTAPNSEDITAPSTGELELQPKKVRGFFDLEFDYIRQNVEGDGINATLNNLFAEQWGEDLLTLGFIGDTTAGSATKLARLLKRLDGFIKLITANENCHDYTINSQDYLGVVFPAMLKMLPAKWRRKRELLRFMVNPDVVLEYENQIIARNTALGDAAAFGTNTNPRYFNKVKILELEAIPVGRPILTIGNNFVFGFGVEMEHGIDVSHRKGLVEHTLRGHVDVGFIEPGAIVMGN